MAPPNRSAAPITGTLRLRKPNARNASKALATSATTGNRRAGTLSTRKTDAANATTMSRLFAFMSLLDDVLLAVEGLGVDAVLLGDGGDDLVGLRREVPSRERGGDGRAQRAGPEQAD